MSVGTRRVYESARGSGWRQDVRLVRADALMGCTCVMTLDPCKTAAKAARVSISITTNSPKVFTSISVSSPVVRVLCITRWQRGGSRWCWHVHQAVLACLKASVPASSGAASRHLPACPSSTAFLSGTLLRRGDKSGHTSASSASRFC